jgi:hypothetical protein
MAKRFGHVYFQWRPASARLRCIIFTAAPRGYSRKMKAFERDMAMLIAVSNMSIRAAASSHIHSFINSCLDDGFSIAHANRDQQFPHESGTWPELSCSNMHDTMIRGPTEIERQELNICSKGSA